MNGPSSTRVEEASPRRSSNNRLATQAAPAPAPVVTTPPNPVVAQAATEPAPAEPSAMSVKQLKALAKERGVDVSNCFEKSDIIRALEAPPVVATPPVEAAPPEVELNGLD